MPHDRGIREPVEDARWSPSSGQQIHRSIWQIFVIESHCQNMTPADWLLVRQRESRVILVQIEEMLLRALHAVLPQSAFGKALHDLQGRWSKRVRYVENGVWPYIEQCL